jgi:hypothetical protein
VWHGFCMVIAVKRLRRRFSVEIESGKAVHFKRIG